MTERYLKNKNPQNGMAVLDIFKADVILPFPTIEVFHIVQNEMGWEKKNLFSHICLLVAFVLFLHKPCHQPSQENVGREGFLVVLTVCGLILSVLDVR